jgi:hypothetical protein
MTYADLARLIATMDEEQKQTDVTVYCEQLDEYFPVYNMLYIASEETNDVLDDKPPYLYLRTE